MSDKQEIVRLGHPSAGSGTDDGAVVYRPKQRNAFVPADPRPAQITVLPPHETSMAVQHPATQQVVVQTSATDRAKGYQLVITPLAAALALLAVLASLLFKNEFFSFASLLIFWVVFCGVWLAGWIVTALATPEAVSFYSAKRQWDVIEREQVERWSHYRWQAGRTDPAPDQTDPVNRLLQDIRLALLIGLAVGIPLAIAVILVLGVES
jgi:hypothetical protein